jgi:hypothetical protein
LKQEKEKQNVTLRGLCVDSRLCKDDWIEGEKERDGTGIRLIVLYLLSFLDEESEGKVILKSILTFKDLSVLSTKITCHCLKDRNTVQNLTP